MEIADNMKFQLALILVALGGVACAQNIETMDRTERPTLSGLSPADRASSQGGWGLGIMPYFSYFTGNENTFYGPGLTVFLRPPHGNGMGNSTVSYRLDTVLATGFNREFRDVFLADVQLTPNSWPIVISGTYTLDNLRDESKYTGWGGTASKSFGLASGQTLELAVTGTDERISFTRSGINSFGHSRVGSSDHSSVWDASAGVYYEGGFALILDYVFKSDVEGFSTWWAQAYAPLTKNIGVRFGVAEKNIFGFQVGYKF